MIKETKDYEIFNKFGHNRQLNEKNVQRLMKSISSRNLLERKPILVDGNLQVVDGQHRLEACKRLGIPVFYEIDKNCTKEDIIRLNENCRGWDKEDYLNYWVQDGNRDYEKLQKFMQRHKINIQTAMTILNCSKRTSYGDAFKKGLFKFPSEEEVQLSDVILEKSNAIINYIYPKLEQPKKYIHGTNFKKTLYRFLSIQSVDFDLFMQKIKYRLDLLRPCVRISESINVLKQIYNWKNQNPVSISNPSEFD